MSGTGPDVGTGIPAGALEPERSPERLSDRSPDRRHRGAPARVTVKIASEPWEFEEIHRLNYKTFVEEIPQHRANASRTLVDRFDRENTYIVAVSRRRLLAMIAVRGTRPFSLDAKLPDLDAYLPPGRRLCEFRLLAVEKQHRAGRLLQPLIAALWRHCAERGYDLALASGTTRQLKLYAHLGFVPFGPLVGDPGAQYQPMMLTLDAARLVVGRVARSALARSPRPRRDAATQSRSEASHAPGAEVTLLVPGPVPVRARVQEALHRPAVSHRSGGFAAEHAAVQSALRRLTSAAHVQVLLGSGTLANDVVAGQLSLDRRVGLVLSNGEFGDRLLDHAQRFGLPHDALHVPWGSGFDLDAIERRLDAVKPGWLWFVHLETSTGVLNDFGSIARACRARGVDTCVDAISSIGNVAVDLASARFATGVSGKGLASYPGVALVFHDRPALGRNRPANAVEGRRLPRYLDLALYDASEAAVPFTHSSNLIAALHAALQRDDWDERFAAVAAQTTWLCDELRRRGLAIVAAPRDQAPAIVTIALPHDRPSTAIAATLAAEHIVVAAHSGYLVERNWIQISVMGEPSRDVLLAVIDRICAAVC